MKLTAIVLIWLFALTPTPPAFAQRGSTESLIEELESAIGQKDDLKARLVVKKLSLTSRNLKQWQNVREMIFKRPQMGYDFAAKWDRMRPRGPISKTEQRGNQLIAKADELQLQEKFQESFRIYQTVARIMKQDLLRDSVSQRFAYWTVVHNMARSLYGAGRFGEALEVYEWIPPDYYKYREVLFEKMWAAFRARRYDVTLGSIASQQSSYYATYLEPETYLVQLYLFKKLCRNDQYKRSMAEIEKIIKRLEPGGSYNLKEWAQADLETKVLFQLMDAVVPVDEDRPAKLREQESIRKILQGRFATEKVRLVKQFNVVLAYSRLSVALDKELIVTDVVPDRAQLMRSKKEFWPVEDAEDWVDELGQQLYIGESRCGKSR